MLRLEKIVGARLSRQRHERQQGRRRGEKHGLQTDKATIHDLNDVDVHAGSDTLNASRLSASHAAGKVISGSQLPTDTAWPISTPAIPAKKSTIAITTTDGWAERATATATATTESILERVRIIRVFDFIGLEEAVVEIVDELGRQADMYSRSCMSQMEVSEKPERSDYDMESLGMKKNLQRKEVIVDSEDEDEDGEENSDEEMLLKPRHNDKAEENPNNNNKTTETERKTEASAGRGLMVIDSFTQVVNPLRKRNFVFGTCENQEAYSFNTKFVEKKKKKKKKEKQNVSNLP